MTKPVTIPNTFATATTAIPLSQLDSDFSTVATALNDANTYSNYAADTGVANAYVVTLTGVSTTYSAGLRIQFKASAANTGASTLNVNGGGTKNITFQDASALSSGTIAANAIVDVMYDGTQFLLMNDPAGAVGTGDVVGPASAVDNQIVLFNSTTGKLVKAATTTGLLKATTGVIAAAASGTDYAPATTGSANQLLASSGSGGFNNVTTGTGVVTALGVNTGSAGAFVVNGGALGTPSSGTATNLTGLPLSTGVTGQLAIANGGTGQSTQTAAFDALAPTTTKGDLIVSDGSDNIRLAVGTNGYVLMADSAQTAGVKWAAASGGLPGGSDTQVQFNDSGSFGGDAGLTYNKTTDVLTVAGSVSVNGITAGRGAGSISTNTAFGASALGANTTGEGNVAVGYQALDANTTGIFNSAVGNSALGSNNTGGYNVAFGYEALYLNTAGTNNSAVGFQALYKTTTGIRNTAVGNQTLYNNTTGANNTALGVEALYANTTGASNTAVGFLAGDSITTGSSNVFIGSNVDASAATGTNQIVIGVDITGQANTNVTIGNSAGKIYNAYTVNATWTQTSDGTMKNIVGTDTLGLSFINRLNPIKFTWKPQNELPVDHPYYREVNGKDTTTVIHGFVAQEVKAALDAEGCTTFNGWDQGNDGIQAISREMFISPLVKAVQELSAQVQALQAEIATLKAS